MGASRWAIGIAAVLLGLVASFAAGFFLGKPRPVSPPSALQVRQAQQAANAYLPPGWPKIIGDDALLRGLRDRGYLYCYRDGRIDPACGREQDEAVQNVFLALTIVAAQHVMPNKDRLTARERTVAQSDTLAGDVRRYCWRLYVAHGKQDARVLGLCLGNMTEFSPLVGIPVP